MAVLREAYMQLEKTFELAGKKLPDNREGSHQRDCLVINTAIALNQQKDLANFDTVRGAYLDGAPVYPGAMIFEQTHIFRFVCEIPNAF